ncbi:hypothetical protein DSECCO2_200340 [anaerobic digester metagenome]
MGVLKNVGRITGMVAGTVIGGPVYIAGKAVDSDLLCGIGEGVYMATEYSGELLGSVTEGVVEKVHGIVKKDNDK